MKSMNSFGRLGANRSHSRSYGEDLQRRMVDEDAISCERFGKTQYQCLVAPVLLHSIDLALPGAALQMLAMP